MKKAFAAFLMLLLFSCKKEDTEVIYGDYSGNIDVWINHTKQRVMTGHVIRVHPATDEKKITLSQNVMITATVEISGTRLTIPKATVGTGPDMKVVEYGSGSLGGDQLTIEFYQELHTGGTLRTTTKWTGTLTRK